MRGDILKLLAYEAERKQEVGEIYNNIDDYSEEQIINANLPLKWMNRALLVYKEKLQFEKSHQEMHQEMPRFGVDQTVGSIYVLTEQLFVLTTKKLGIDIEAGRKVFISHHSNGEGKGYYGDTTIYKIEMDTLELERENVVLGDYKTEHTEFLTSLL